MLGPIFLLTSDAVLFSGTVRDNLDPFNEHPDADLVDALIRVNLITGQTPAVSRAPSHARLATLVAEDEAGSGGATPSSRVHITLSTEVSAGGANFSQGQRQLVAMARALLRRSNLIVSVRAPVSDTRLWMKQRRRSTLQLTKLCNVQLGASSRSPQS